MKLTALTTQLTHSLTNKKTTALLAALTSILASQYIATAQAANYTVDVGVSRTYNDNATLENIAQSDDENNLFTHFAYDHEGKTIITELGYQIEYTDFEGNTNNDDLSTNGSSQLTAKIIPERFLWLASHQIDRYLSNRNNVDSSDNQETRQNFSTGPQVTLPLTKVDQLSLSAQYSKNTFDKAENPAVSTNVSDTETLGGNVSFIHSLSEISQFNITYSYTRLDYDVISPIAQFESYSAGYATRLASGSYNIQIGSNNSSFGSQPDSTGFFYSVDFNKEFSGQEFSFNSSRKLSDPTQNSDDRNSIVDSLGLTQQNIDIQDTVEKTLVKLSYSASKFCRSCKYGLSLSFIEDDYTSDINSIRDEQISSYQAYYTHNFAKNLIGTLTYNQINTDYINANIDDQENRLEFNLNWRSSEKLSVQFRTSYSERDNDSTIDHDQITASLGFTYNLVNSK